MFVRFAAVAAAALLIGTQRGALTSARSMSATAEPAVVSVPVAAPPAAPTASTAPGRLDTTRYVATGPITRFADPAILQVGAVYYAYATGSGNGRIPVMSSPDLVHWTTPHDALPMLPAWSGGRTWAPSVLARNGRYVMWYTTRDRASALQCISVASSDNPDGPFIDTSAAPALCQPERAGSIDPDVFTDKDGSYLLWKSEDNALGRPTAIWAARLTAGGMSLAGPPVQLLTANAPWQAALVEGPTMVVHNGRFYLLYGANNWATASAAIGYATCDSPLGPCEERSAVPWLASAGTQWGPSGPDVFADAEGNTRLAYHAWPGCSGPLAGGGCTRALFIATLGFRDGRPVLLEQ